MKQCKEVIDVHTLTYYICSIKTDIRAVKLHKSLYFLLGYFGAYFDTETPLFSSKVEAWKYGPVVREVYDKHDYYTDKKKMDEAVNTVSQNKELKGFIESLLEQTTSVSDFTLIERSKSDRAFQNARDSNESICYSMLKNEYKECYV